MAGPVLRPAGRQVVRQLAPGSGRMRQRRRNLLLAGAGVSLVVGFSVLLLLAASVLLFVPLGADDEQQQDQNCVTGDGTGAPGQLDAKQQGNANTIMQTGERLGVPTYGWVVALATAMQESTLRNLDHGDRDSVGLFQQRDAWGPREDRMDPKKSTEMFFNGGQQGQSGLLDIDGWEDMPVAEAAQAVQRSAFPDAYAQHESLARELVAQYGGKVGDDCGPIPQMCPETPWPNVEESLTPDAKLVMRCSHQKWPEFETFHGVGDRPQGGDGDHAAGRAVDMMIPYDDYRSSKATDYGWGVVEWLQANHAKYGIKYIIYDKQIWSVRRADEGWRDYDHYAGCTSDTCLHYDHIHVSVYGNAAAGMAVGDWTTPVRKGDYELTAEFGSCGDNWSNCHTGLDFAAEKGTPALAAAAGTVTEVRKSDGGYGTMVKIAHDEKVSTLYGHLSSVVPDLEGRKVKPGMMIGEVGSTGNSTGPHLHFEVRMLDNPVNPEEWLQKHGVDP